MSSPARTSAGRRKRSFTGAAFFDLDRTLLQGASGPVYSEALRDVGILPEQQNRVEPFMFKIFDLFGENYPSMLIARQGAKFAKGWNVAKVKKAALLATDELLRRLQPYARGEFEMHREAGRALVLATTTPRHLVEPLAKALGFDHVIATHYADDGSVFTGTVDGPFVWGKGKAAAVAEWAAEKGIELSESYAYSDSYYDAPLLSMVGHPTAVNPDPRMMALAVLRRWPTRYLDAPVGVPKFAGLEPQNIAMLLSRQEFMPYVNFKVYGANRIPEHGPAIIVGNHRSYFDPLAIGYVLSKRGRPVRFLGKKEVFDAPIVGDFARAMGGIRVERGTGSDEPLRAAEEALAAGEMVAMMPQGTIPRGREFYSAELKGRWGAARLAAASGAPVVPIGLWGTEQVWPRSARVPSVATLLHRPTVTIRVGSPVELKYDSLEADTARIMSAISALLPAAGRVDHEPTEEEIKRALPPGVEDVDADHEATRRPGTD
jgi:putative phosphoserine phosphatase/1-acylglycerol-3-phosphate O-acyltransferase